MPATRSPSVQPRPQPFPTPSPPHKHRTRNVTRDSQTINLTSSDGESPRAPLKTMRPNRAQAGSRPKKPPFVPPTDEVIEISSDDEGPAPVTSQTSIVADFRRQISKLREESVKHKRDFERASKQLKEVKEENQQLQAQVRKPDNGKILLDVEQLSDHLDCEICTGRMWTPYILPDCGHSFCQSCLQDWFSTIQAQFLTTHPVNDPQQLHNMDTLTRLCAMIAQNPHLAHRQDITDMLIQMLPPHPNYTCPTCREPVRSCPTEAFSLKALVRTIASAVGENSPKKATAPSRKGKTPGAAPGPWDGFFPPRKT